MEIGAFQRTLRGEDVCGDAYAVVSKQETTIVVADGLGHGPEAAAAAQLICRYVEEHADESLDTILQGATLAAKGTRGAAVALLRIGARRLSFSAVGNVELRTLTRRPFSPVGAPGIVARPLRRVRVFEHLFDSQDLFALFTDGISTSFSLDGYESQPVQRIAESVVSSHGKAHDDATCVVVRV